MPIEEMLGGGLGVGEVYVFFFFYICDIAQASTRFSSIGILNGIADRSL